MNLPEFRVAGEGDLEAVARIHKLAYSRRHFTSLLPRDLLKSYYRYFLDDGAEILLLLDGSAAIIGFAVYGERISERILAFKHAYRVGIAKTALQHPLQSIPKASRQLVAKLRRKPSAPPPAPFLLLSIAVARKSEGAGRALLAEMLRRAARAGHSRAGLYVNVDNLGAINSYAKGGFRLVSLIDRQYYMEGQVAAD